MPLYLGIDGVYSLDLLSTTHEAYHPPPCWYALPTTRVRAMAITMYAALLLIIRGVSYTCTDGPCRRGGIPTTIGPWVNHYRLVV